MLVEISNGDLIDKISILEIKLEKLKNNEEKLKNVEKEYKILSECLQNINFSLQSLEYKKLKSINELLWDTEEKVRKETDYEKKAKLSEIIHTKNDERHKIKKQINELTNSEVFEEKSYE
jgi:hypothetical protein